MASPEEIEEDIKAACDDLDHLRRMLAADGPGAVYDAINALDEGDVRHMVFSVVVMMERGEGAT